MRKASTLFATCLLGLVAVFGYAQAPVPFINQPLVPDAAAPGGADFTLTVNGTGFVSSSVVNWNGSPLATTFVSASKLTAIVPAADIATASTGSVIVVNPAPGGGTSSVDFFTVTPDIGNSVGFTMAKSFSYSNAPTSVAVADFNGDGNLDLAVSNCGSIPSCYYGQVAILLGDGKGNFTPTSSPPAVEAPGPLVTGDFNGDGKPDLAVAGGSCSPYGCISILLGDGTGNFTLASTPATATDFISGLAVGDFDGDGKLDLAALASGFGPSALTILLGDGTGHFTLRPTIDTGGSPSGFAVGDFNGDGKLDIAIGFSVSGGPGTVSVFAGDGTGNFALASSLPTGFNTAALAAGDFNADGNLDLAVVNECGNSGCYWPDAGSVSIFLGDGAGNFTLASSPGTGNCANSIATGDFNGDGNLDLAVGSCPDNEGSMRLSVLLGDGTGNFTLLPPLAAGWSVPSLSTGDFNGDGKLDLAVVDVWSKSLYLMLQVPPYATAILSNTALSFGAQLFDTTSASQYVTLTNTGMATLNIGSITASANFTQTNDCGTSLPPAGVCYITISFSPRTIGALTGTVTITDDAANSPQTVSLTGSGTVVAWRPTGLNWNAWKVGTTSYPQTVILSNRGNRPLSVSGALITGPNASEFTETNTCGSTVPAGGSCTFSVRFTPQAAGWRQANLGVADNGGASPQVVALQGWGMQ